jgi:uncharacterized protein (TIGR00369 family)
VVLVAFHRDSAASRARHGTLAGGEGEPSGPLSRGADDGEVWEDLGKQRSQRIDTLWAMSPTPLHDRVSESFQRQRLLSTLGARLLRVADGEVDIELPWSEAIQQQHGFVHAGAIATIADSACGYACLTRMPEGSAVLSVEFKINLLAPAVGERFVARGRVVRVGRTVGVATAEVIAMSASKADVCVGLMQATMMRVEPKNGAGG